MQLVFNEDELAKIIQLLDDGKQWDRDINDPRRTALEKVMVIKDRIDNGKAWAAAIVAVEEE